MSATKLSRFSRSSLAGAVLLIAASLLLSATQARTETVKFRGVFHQIKVEDIEVGDVPGNVIGIAENKGLVFFENGEVATYSEVLTFDFTNGSFTGQGYTIITFEDGSTQVIKFLGTDKEKGLWKGTFTYLRGSGRFEGIKGSGSFTGKFFESIATGYDDFTGTYTLPKK